jgi:hypothetical protein
VLLPDERLCKHVCDVVLRRNPLNDDLANLDLLPDRAHAGVDVIRRFDAGRVDEVADGGLIVVLEGDGIVVGGKGKGESNRLDPFGLRGSGRDGVGLSLSRRVDDDLLLLARERRQ